MKSKVIHESGDEKTVVLVFEMGDEVMSTLLDFVRREDLGAARFTGIGALSGATLGYYDWVKKDYEHSIFNEQVEVLSLIGDVAMSEGEEPVIHAHVVLGRPDASTIGGHLIEAHVRPTLELVIVESPAHLHKVHDPESGLALIRL